MRILVCVKQVADPEGAFALDEAAGRLTPLSATPYRIGRTDEIAIEAAVRLKEDHPGTIVDLVTVGPERAAEALRRGLGMGADHGIHVAGEVPEAGRIARALAACARRRDYRAILCGVMSEDLMQGRVGPAVAALLDWPCATAAVALALSADGGRLEVEREIEAGGREVVALGLPAVVTLQSGVYRPRYPALSNLLRANRQALEIVAPEGGDGGEPAPVFAWPKRARAARMLSGERREKAAELVRILREKALLPGRGYAP
jgi:electron transfer flavoprotein beta subunit